MPIDEAKTKIILCKLNYTVVDLVFYDSTLLKKGPYFIARNAYTCVSDVSFCVAEHLECLIIQNTSVLS